MEPTTVHGVNLRDWAQGHESRVKEAILAIEAEARDQGAKAERERLRVAVEILPTFTLEKALAPYYVRRADVQSLLDEPT